MFSATTKRTIPMTFALLFLTLVLFIAVPKADASIMAPDVPNLSGYTAEEAAQVLSASPFDALREKFVSADNLPSDAIPHFANK